MMVVQLITRLIVGGAQRIALETAAGLLERGVDVELWCGPQEGPEGSLRNEAARRGIPVRTIPDLIKEIDPIRDLRSLSLLAKEMRTRRPDLVHTHSSKAGIVGRRAARAAGVPIAVHTVHGWGFSERTPAAARLAFVAAERLAARWTDALIAVSQATRDEGLHWRIGRTDTYKVIRPGISAAPYQDLDSIRRGGRELRARLGIPDDALVAGTVGRLSPQKNPKMILDAAARFPRVHWVVVGDGPMRDEIEERISGEGLTDRVHLVGPVGAAHEVLGAFDLFVLTSLWEGYPLTLLEASAAGLPVVAPDVGGVSEALPPPPAGFLFPAGGLDGLCGALTKIIGSPEPARQAARRHREKALLEHRIEDSVGATIDLYDQIRGRALSSSRRSP